MRSIRSVTVVLAATAVVLVGCSSGDSQPVASQPASVSPTAEPSPETSTDAAASPSASASDVSADPETVLQAGQISQDGLDRINGGFFGLLDDDPESGYYVRNPGDDEFERMVNRDEVGPACDDEIAVTSWTQQGWDDAGVSVWAEVAKINVDVIQDLDADIASWISHSYWTSPEKAQSIVDASIAALPACLEEIRAGGDAEDFSLSDSLGSKSENAYVLPTGRGTGVHVLEAIGSVVFDVSTGDSLTSGAMSEETVSRIHTEYNQLADAMADEQGVTREHVDIAGILSALPQANIATSVECLEMKPFGRKIIKNYSTFYGPGEGSDVFVESRVKVTNNCGKAVKAFEYGVTWEDDFGDLLLNCQFKVKKTIKHGAT